MDNKSPVLDSLLAEKVYNYLKDNPAASKEEFMRTFCADKTPYEGKVLVCVHPFGVAHLCELLLSKYYQRFRNNDPVIEYGEQYFRFSRYTRVVETDAQRIADLIETDRIKLNSSLLADNLALVPTDSEDEDDEEDEAKQSPKRKSPLQDTEMDDEDGNNNKKQKKDEDENMIIITKVEPDGSRSVHITAQSIDAKEGFVVGSHIENASSKDAQKLLSQLTRSSTVIVNGSIKAQGRLVFGDKITFNNDE